MKLLLALLALSISSVSMADTYVKGHVKPLKRGGADDKSNMQWQTVEDAKAKDKWE